MPGLNYFVLARKAGRGPLRSNGGGEGSEVEVPSSIPFHFVKRAPFLLASQEKTKLAIFN